MKSVNETLVDLGRRVDALERRHPSGSGIVTADNWHHRPPLDTTLADNQPVPASPSFTPRSVSGSRLWVADIRRPVPSETMVVLRRFNPLTGEYDGEAANPVRGSQITDSFGYQGWIPGQDRGIYTNLVTGQTMRSSVRRYPTGIRYTVGARMYALYDHFTWSDWVNGPLGSIEGYAITGYQHKGFFPNYDKTHMVTLTEQGPVYTPIAVQHIQNVQASMHHMMTLRDYTVAVNTNTGTSIIYADITSPDTPTLIHPHHLIGFGATFLYDTTDEILLRYVRQANRLDYVSTYPRTYAGVEIATWYGGDVIWSAEHTPGHSPTWIVAVDAVTGEIINMVHAMQYAVIDVL